MLRMLGLLVLISGACQPLSAEQIAGKLRVIDGDTVDVGETRIRLHGIDAPERNQPCTTLTGQNWACGDWVTRQVQDRFGGAIARCDPVDQDRYGRIVARCFVAGQDIGRALVADGLAYAYRRYSDDYDLEEKAAFVGDLGIHGFTLQSPARYRLTRIQGREAPDQSCQIKGNITRQGERIYHMPGQRFYGRTGIRPEQGERWFCSEAQARASGWRAAIR